MSLGSWWKLMIGNTKSTWMQTLAEDVEEGEGSEMEWYSDDNGTSSVKGGPADFYQMRFERQLFCWYSRKKNHSDHLRSNK
jgi:hypothetical protein